MNLLQTIDILQAGGAGSGCNPAAAKKEGKKCGRPPKGKSKSKASTRTKLDKAKDVAKSVATHVGKSAQKLALLQLPELLGPIYDGDYDEEDEDE
jgi:hypothetical protein